MAIARKSDRLLAATRPSTTTSPSRISTVSPGRPTTRFTHQSIAWRRIAKHDRLPAARSAPRERRAIHQHAISRAVHASGGLPSSAIRADRRRGGRRKRFNRAVKIVSTRLAVPRAVRTKQRRGHRAAGDHGRHEQALRQPAIRNQREQRATDKHANRTANGRAVRRAVGCGDVLRGAEGRTRGDGCGNQSRYPGEIGGYFSEPVSSTAKKAFCGMSTLPIDFIRFLPSFCLAHSFRLRVMSPP